MARTVAASQGRTNRRFLFIALLLAGLSAVLIYAVLARNSSSEGGTTASAGTTPVVVAKTTIKQNTVVTAEMLEIKNVPANAVVTGAFVTQADVIGKVTKFPVEANQQVVANAVIDLSNPASTDALAAVVPAGRRAISVSVGQVTNAGGLILPGDFVDVVWTCCEEKGVVSKTILKNVQVAAIAQSKIDSGPAVGEGNTSGPVSAGEEKPDPEAVTTTLLLTPDEAQVAFLAESSGKLRFSLRGLGDEQIVDPDFLLLTELLPESVLAGLPEGLKPDGYKRTE